MTLPKRLKYNNRFLDALIQATPNEVAFLPIADQVEFPDQATKTLLLWDVSLDEWTMVFSSLCTGADLLYGDNAINVVEIFLRTIGEDMDLCDYIAACIDNSENVQQSIQNYLQQNGYSNRNATIPPLPLPIADTGANLLPGGYICDTAHLCGMARAIVQSSHGNVVELLQQFEELTDPLEFVSVFVDNVEGVSYFGSAVEFGAWLQDELFENYDSAWSATVENNLTCAIYCLIEPSCQVTLDLIIQALGDYISSVVALPDLNDIQAIWSWLDDIIYGSVADTVFVAVFHWAMWQVLRFGGTTPAMFLGIQTLEDMILQNEDETDTYCTSAPCSCAPEIWCYENDFEVGLGDWSIRTQSGTPIGTLTANGVEAVNFSGNSQTQIYLEASAVYAWKNVEIEYVRSGADGNSQDDTRIFIATNTNAGTGQLQIASTSGINTNGTLVECYETANGTQRLQLMVALRANGTGHTLTIKRVKVWGVGEPPSGITDNECVGGCT